MKSYNTYLKLHRKKREIEGQLDELKDKIRTFEEFLLQKFEDEGVSSVKVGGATLWLDRKIWASAGGDVDGAVAALEQAGEHALVKKTINRNTLSAWVRERADALASPEQIQNDLPHGLGSAIKVTETNNIRVRGL